MTRKNPKTPTKKRTVARVRTTPGRDIPWQPEVTELDDAFWDRVYAEATLEERAEMDRFTKALVDALHAARDQHGHSTDEGELPDEPLLPRGAGGTLAVLVPKRQEAKTKSIPLTAASGRKPRRRR